MTNIDVNINGHKFSAFVSNIIHFLSKIDAQLGTVEESGLANCIKNRITIKENGNEWWSPLQPQEVYKAIASC